MVAVKLVVTRDRGDEIRGSRDVDHARRIVNRVSLVRRGVRRGNGSNGRKPRSRVVDLGSLVLDVGDIVERL
jgi:hypothetical protein